MPHVTTASHRGQNAGSGNTIPPPVNRQTTSSCGGRGVPRLGVVRGIGQAKVKMGTPGVRRNTTATPACQCCNRMGSPLQFSTSHGTAVIARVKVLNAAGHRPRLVPHYDHRHWSSRHRIPYTSPVIPRHRNAACHPTRLFSVVSPGNVLQHLRRIGGHARQQPVTHAPGKWPQMSPQYGHVSWAWGGGGG